MNIIEKQGAVTRLITAIQNRMLKETWLTSHICKDYQGFKENGLPERIFLLDTPPPFKSLFFFSEVEMEFFWRLPTSQQHLVARSYVPQC